MKSSSQIPSRTLLSPSLKPNSSAKLKVVCYDIDVTTNKRSMLGYIMLDLRAAAPLTVTAGRRGDPPAVFYPLNHVVKRGPFRPELKVGFGLFTPPLKQALMSSPWDGGRIRSPSPAMSSPPRRRQPPPPSSLHHYNQQQQTSATAINNTNPSSPYFPPSPAKTAPKPTLLPSGLPVEYTAGGYFQIGFSGPNWLLNITVAFAESLQLLSIDDPTLLLSNAMPFYFYYNLLGTDILTETFSDLTNPRFPSERVTFRLRASEHDLSLFLRDLGAIPIHLCRAGRVLGYAEIPISSILDTLPEEVDENQLVDSTTTPAWSRRRRRARVLERVYTMFDLKQELPVSGDSKIPGLGMSIILAPDDAADGDEKGAGCACWQVVQQQQPKQVGQQQQPKQAGQQQQPKQVGQQQQPKQAGQQQPPVDTPTLVIEPPKSQKRSEQEQPPPQSRPTEQQEPQRRPEQEKKQASLGPPSIQPPPVSTLPRRTSDAQPLPREPPKPQYQPQPQFESFIQRLNPWHQYRFSIDLRTLHLTQPLPDSHLHLKYTYPSFGASLPITTPAVEPLHIKDERIPLPHSFTAFEFMMNVERFMTYVRDVPVWVDLVGDGERVLGRGRMELGGVLEAGERGRVMGVSVRSCGVVVRVLGEMGMEVAEVEGVIAVEDFGEVGEKEMGQFGGGVMGFDVGKGREYKAALDLEIWRRELIERLTAEFAERDGERAEAVRKRVGELSGLEERARRMCVELEVRERGVRREEEEVERLKEEVRREGERRRGEVEGVVERLKEEFRVRMEGVERRGGEGVARVLREKEEVEGRLRRVERELEEARSLGKEVRSDGKLEGVVETLRGELAKMSGEMGRMEKRMEMVDAARKKYKGLWVKTLGELAKVKKGWQVDVQERLAKDQKVVEALRVKMMAREEMEEVGGGRRELEMLRREVEAVKALSPRREVMKSRERKEVSPKRGGRRPLLEEEEEEEEEVETEEDAAVRVIRKKMGRAKENMDPKVYGEIERLARERDSLVKSGVYVREDLLIRELDSRIHTLLTSRSIK
ncbi:Cep120 protein-domain-containing protein [Chytridium lagenaria]|nr:Cep120 protein-domain-containing protein [Chytridium lagenaria]